MEEGEGASNQTADWDLGKAVLSLHRLRAFPLFSVHVGVDDKNSSLNIINVSPFRLTMHPLQSLLCATW